MGLKWVNTLVTQSTLYILDHKNAIQNGFYGVNKMWANQKLQNHF